MWGQEGQGTAAHPGRCTQAPLEGLLSVVLCDAARYKEHCAHLGVCGSLFCLDFLIFNT